jgi:MFS family permease
MLVSRLPGLRFLVLLRASWPLLLGIALMMLGNGLQGTLLGVRASLEGFEPAVTGLVMSGYYVGLLLGSLATPGQVARVGHVRVFAALLSLGSTGILFHALLVEPVAWFAARALTGYCFAGAFIVAESWLNGSATNENRGALLSTYMVVQLGGLALGQFLLNLADPRGFSLFMLVSVLVSVAAVPMLLTASPAPAVRPRQSVGFRELYRLSPLGVVGVVGVGFSNSALYAMGPVFAEAEGLSVALISAFMAAVIGGGVALQWPIGMLSDLFDRRRVIAATTLLAALVAASSLVMAGPPAWWLFAQFFLVGGLVLPMYALCAAHTNDFLSREQMVGASSALLLAYCLGAVLGPTLAASFMQALGPAGYPLFLAAVHGGIGAFALWRMTRRPVVPAEERVRHVAVATPSPVVTQLAGAGREEGRGEASRPGGSGVAAPAPAAPEPA